VNAPVGPTANPRSYCSPGEEPPARRVSLGASWLSTTLSFGGADAPLSQTGLLAAGAFRLGERFTLQAGAGALLGGTLSAGGVDYRIQPGWLAQAGLTWLALDGETTWPFLSVSATLAASGARTTAGGQPDETLTALDAGLSIAVGKSFLGWLSPYVGVKVFGGPVFWTLAGAPVTGTDVHHYQVALGVAAALPGGFDVVVEGSPLGAQGVTGAVGWAF
jgi:hypothetical protein